MDIKNNCTLKRKSDESNGRCVGIIAFMETKYKYQDGEIRNMMVVTTNQLVQYWYLES